VVYAIIQAIEGFYLSPRVLGHDADMHPVTAFVSVIIGANLLGLLGAILAIPLAATVKILFTELLAPELRAVAGMGPGTETGQTRAIARQVRGELIGGGLVPTELDREPGA
jgi:predicted PurR-regulated permease PerM